MVHVLVGLAGFGAAAAWHYLGVGLEREIAEPRSALVARAFLHAVQFGLGYLLGKLYLLRCGQVGGRGFVVRFLEAVILPAAALLLSTRSHEIALWFSGPAALFWFALAVVIWSDLDGWLRSRMVEKFRLDARERPLYLHFPPRNLADMLPWHVFVAAFVLWASWRIVMPMLVSVQ